MLVSMVPIEEIETIVLDYQSRTSVLLVRILARDYWKISPHWQNGGVKYIQEDIKGTTAGVIIGDRVFEAETKFPYVYDLGEAWKAHTGLDFVFACWVANRPIDRTFVLKFEEALEHGIVHIPDVIPNIFSNIRIILSKNISRRIFFTTSTTPKERGWSCFLS